MSQKRQERGEGTASEEKRPRKFRSLKSVVMDVIDLRKFQSLMEPALEPLIRRVVKEEIELALRNYIISVKHNSAKDAECPESTSLQLQFLNNISLPVFTGTRIEGISSSSIEVALIETHTGNIVSSGPESSAQVEIVVLEGDFDGDGRDNWTFEDFKNNIVKERAGKKPLLNGEVKLMLENGRGLVGDVMFTDNSSWTRSRKFRLGARIVSETGGICIREARSEPFIVRDHRGELYKKHHPPSLSDEVWRLEKIGKDGAFHKRLRKERVNTVEDFLLLLSLDPSRLRNILGSGMSTKMWEVTVDHAQTCVVDGKLYLYNTHQNNGVVFSIVGQVIGNLYNGQFVPADKLSEAEKEDAREIVKAASKDRDRIFTFDDKSSWSIHNNTPGSSNVSNFPFKGDDYDSHQINKSTVFPQTPTSPGFISSAYSIGGLNNFDDCLHNSDNHVGNSYEQSLSYPGQASDSLISETNCMTPILCTDEQLNYFDEFPSSNFDLTCDIQNAISAFIPYPKVSADKAQKGWAVLVSVIRWCFSIKRIVRNSRVAHVPPTYCS